MPDMLAIAQGLNALKATTDIIKTICGLRDAAQILEKTVELNQQILSVQSALAEAQAEQTALVKTISQLEEEITRLKAWETEKQRYELKDLISAAYAYVIKPTSQGSEPLHCICANCYERGKKRIMQRAGAFAPNSGALICPECKNQIFVGHWPPLEAQPAPLR